MYRLALLALVASVSANCCPKVDPVDNFQFAAWGQGTWYEVARYPSPGEDGTTCGHAQNKLEGDEVKVTNYFVRNNKAASIEGVAKLAPDAGQTGKILFKMTGRRGALIENTLDIMAIEYDKYAITYFCKFDEATHSHRDYAWVFSRSKVLPEDAKAAVDKFLSESKVLEAKKFIWPSFSDEDCKVDA
ncbi:unnamed protein product, partial [Brenthis ino]